MDITVEVMLPPRGETFATERNGRYRVLMPVAVYPRKKVDMVGMPHTGYIHVTNVPDRVSIQRLNELLCDPWEQDVLIGQEPVRQLVERRRWKGDHTLLPLAARATLLRDRQVEIGFLAFLALMRNLAEGDRALSEVDLEGAQ